MSVHGASITTISSNGESIPRKKKNKISGISITGNWITKELDNQSKNAKVGSSIDETKINLELTPPPNKKSKTTQVVLMIRHVILRHVTYH